MRERILGFGPVLGPPLFPDLVPTAPRRASVSAGVRGLVCVCVSIRNTPHLERVCARGHKADLMSHSLLGLIVPEKQ